MTASIAAAPVRENERIKSLDVIRGIALFGILLMNITAFGLPHAYSDPTVYGGASGANLWAWITSVMLFEGTQRGLFSILFGAGVILLTSRGETAGRTDTADIYYRRNIWLVLFGLVHSYLLLWLGEILYYYGTTALFLYPMRKLAPRTLFALAASGLVIASLWSGAETYRALETWDKNVAAQAVLDAGGELTKKQKRDVEGWKEIEDEYKPDEMTLQEDIDAHRGSYLDVLIFQAPINAKFESWWYYRYFFDLFSMMLVGMAIFRLGVLTLERPLWIYWVMVLAGYAVGLSVNYYETRILLDGEFSVLAQMQAGITYDLGRLGMTFGHLGLLLLFCRSGWLAWLQRALAAVGRMALSSYVSHSLICAVLFYGFGFRLYAQLERHQLYYVVVSIWIFQLIVSPLWLKHYRFGPVEWLWRSLTYLKRQPMRRRGGEETPTGTPQPA